MTEQDIYDIAEYVVRNINTLRFEHTATNAATPFKDFLLNRVISDLLYKYTNHEIKLAFEDSRVQYLIQVMCRKNGGRNVNKKTQVH